MSTVNTFDPADATRADLHITPAAIRHLRTQLAKENARALLLSVKPSGCSGYMYVMDFAREQPAGARVFRFEDVEVWVDGGSLGIINGTEVDYVTEGLNSAFRFNNPNVTGACGCGESFTVN